jgi:hypothetical protein
MTDAKTLLTRHLPRLAYDSMEAYFADSAAIWTDSPSTQLRRADGTVLAAAPALSLAFLGAKTYGDGSAVMRTDAIGETTRDYARHAAALHAQPRYANRVHGAVRKDDQGRTWLQYWFFYYYNNFQLIGPLLSAGNHEGDWEMIQLLLDADEQPVTAVYAQHKGGESRPWAQVARAGADPDSPVVYVARGSHASYFTAGQHWTGTWWDNADGTGPHVTPALVVLGDAQPGWAHWPGFWGDTKGTGVNSTSPIGPGPHRQWHNPALLAAAAAVAAAAAKPAPPAVPAAPKIAVRREGDHAVVSYELPDPAARVVVAVRPAGEAAPAETHSVAVDGATGELAVPLGGDGAFEIHASAAAPSGAASASTSTTLRG